MPQTQPGAYLAGASPAAAHKYDQSRTAVAKRESRLPLVLGLLGGGVVLVAVALVISLVMGVWSSPKDPAQLDAIKIGPDTVPTVKAILGEARDLTGFTEEAPGGVGRVTMRYSVASKQGDEMFKYATALVTDDGFDPLPALDFTAPVGTNLKLGRVSATAGFAVVVRIDYDASGYVVTLARGQGTVDEVAAGVEPSAGPATPPGSSSQPPGGPAATNSPPGGSSPSPSETDAKASRVYLQMLDTGDYDILFWTDDGPDHTLGPTRQQWVSDGMVVVKTTLPGGSVVHTAVRDGGAYILNDDKMTMTPTDEATALATAFPLTPAVLASRVYQTTDTAEFFSLVCGYDEYTITGGRLRVFTDSGHLVGIQIITRASGTGGSGGPGATGSPSTTGGPGEPSTTEAPEVTLSARISALHSPVTDKSVFDLSGYKVV